MKLFSQAKHRIVNYKRFNEKHKTVWNEVHVESENIYEMVADQKLQISTMMENYFCNDILNGDKQGLFDYLMFKKFLIHVEVCHKGKESKERRSVFVFAI